MTRLLATTALLALLAGGAHAGELHKEMLGGWCATGVSDSDGWFSSTYQRSTRRACAGDWLQLNARGYVEHLDVSEVPQPITCRFATITQTDRSTFAVSARCRAERSGWYLQQLEFSMTAGDVLTGSVKLQLH